MIRQHRDVGERGEHGEQAQAGQKDKRPLQAELGDCFIRANGQNDHDDWAEQVHAPVRQRQLLVEVVRQYGESCAEKQSLSYAEQQSVSQEVHFYIGNKYGQGHGDCGECGAQEADFPCTEQICQNTAQNAANVLNTGCATPNPRLDYFK